ncbi:hypothetical protein J7E88_19235 [Streptomyces sp. ISL-10]|uniref:hypothetical protein n=1 Tax=Streptomyces sp. ISL-10 TaxID=2819172 RepID=UPI001BE94618|nr:hypothetical protein [Streptomyces sp. ISL-10]MBT2367378.1 hypothetical protein [Streptomyces sp. ISL-10]
MRGALGGRRPVTGRWAAPLRGEVLQRTTAFGHYDDGLVLALEKRTARDAWHGVYLVVKTG